MQVDIITPDEKLFSGTSSSLIVPGSDGSLGILDNHAPLIASLKAGVISIKTTEGEKTFEVTSGVVEVLNNNVVILAEK